MELKDDNHISIPAKARTIFDLKGNELLVYGLIHGFSQDRKSWFTGNLQYIADWCGLSNKQRALDVIKRLLDKGCIRKREIEIDRNIKKCDYQAIIPDERAMPLLKEQRGVAETATNINNNIIPTVNTSKEVCDISLKGEDTPDEEFTRWYNLYGKKVERHGAWKMWKRLTREQKKEVFARTPAYVASTPDKKYRMHPATFLNPVNCRWQDEIITSNTNNNAKTHITNY